jgi:hypothetical protein
VALPDPRLAERFNHNRLEFGRQVRDKTMVRARYLADRQGCVLAAPRFSVGLAAVGPRRVVVEATWPEDTPLAFVDIPLADSEVRESATPLLPADGQARSTGVGAGTTVMHTGLVTIAIAGRSAITHSELVWGHPYKIGRACDGILIPELAATRNISNSHLTATFLNSQQLEIREHSGPRTKTRLRSDGAWKVIEHGDTIVADLPAEVRLGDGRVTLAFSAEGLDGGSA